MTTTTTTPNTTATTNTDPTRSEIHPMNTDTTNNAPTPAERYVDAFEAYRALEAEDKEAVEKGRDEAWNRVYEQQWKRHRRGLGLPKPDRDEEPVAVRDFFDNLLVPHLDATRFARALKRAGVAEDGGANE